MLIFILNVLYLILNNKIFDNFIILHFVLYFIFDLIMDGSGVMLHIIYIYILFLRKPINIIGGLSCQALSCVYVYFSQLWILPECFLKFLGLKGVL